MESFISISLYFIDLKINFKGLHEDCTDNVNTKVSTGKIPEDNSQRVRCLDFLDEGSDCANILVCRKQISASLKCARFILRYLKRNLFRGQKGKEDGKLPMLSSNIKNRA